MSTEKYLQIVESLAHKFVEVLPSLKNEDNFVVRNLLGRLVTIIEKANPEQE